MRRPPPPSLILAVALTSGACARPREPADAAAPPAAPPVRVLAEARADSSHLTVRVLEIKRTGPDVVTVALLLVNTGEPGQPFELGAAFASDPRDAGTLADMFLADEAGQRRYFVLRDAADRPRTSVETAALAPGESRAVWASFPAPAPGTARVTVCLPHVPAMSGVPVS
jgi:hypothetical protein